MTRRIEEMRVFRMGEKGQKKITWSFMFVSSENFVHLPR